MSTKDLRSAIWRFCARTALAGDPYELGLRTGPTNSAAVEEGVRWEHGAPKCRKGGVEDATSRATLHVIRFGIKSQYNQQVLSLLNEKVRFVQSRNEPTRTGLVESIA